MCKIPISLFRKDWKFHMHLIREGKGKQMISFKKKIMREKLPWYLPKIFSCLSITVLYNSVSLNHDFSSREEKIFTATFSPCQLPLHTSPYLPFPVESSTEVTLDKTKEVANKVQLLTTPIVYWKNSI